MAINGKTIEAGAHVVLNQDFKNYTKGTELVIHKKMDVGEKVVIMAQVPGSDVRPMGFQPEILDYKDAAAAADEPEQPSPVEDFFGSFAPDADISVNFAEAYIKESGHEDLSLLTSLMEGENVDAGAEWTPEQTAKMYATFLEMNGLDRDPEIDKVLAPAPAEAPKAKGGRPKKDAAPADVKQDAPPKKSVVDKAGWDADFLDAATLVGPLLAAYTSNPGSFDAIVSKAVAMTKAAAAVK